MSDDPTEGDAEPRRRARPAPAQLAPLDAEQRDALRALLRAQLAAQGVRTRDPIRGFDRLARPRPKRERVALAGPVQLRGTRQWGKVVSE